ncbi:LysR substrate-binding domain-containing protein [Dactylosporangium fulvum]|uniref:LysR substrate-binding domain-containing protein n=1 Tax=Dactylosporangium fulvum TaxID=53359 RepID=UPI0029D41684|nr:LysR substrate-binding domain-containing protein [Dactylosporangium fulvum]
MAVAEERHFGRAAERLHIAQPPLSRQIRQLETELGAQLLERNTRKVELTAAGSAYLERAREILTQVEVAGNEAARIASGLQGRLVVSCVGSATYSLLPAFACTLREEIPDVELVLRGELLVPHQVERLLARDIDLAVLRPPVDETALTVRTLRTDRLLVAMPEGHALASRRRLNVKDLRGEDLVVHAGGTSVMYGAVAALFRDAGVEAKFRHEVAETSTLLTFVAAGLGLAVVPEPVSKLGVAGVTFRPVSGEGATIDLCSAVRADDNSATLYRALEVLDRVVRSAAGTKI